MGSTDPKRRLPSPTMHIMTPTGKAKGLNLVGASFFQNLSEIGLPQDLKHTICMELLFEQGLKQEEVVIHMIALKCM